MSDTNFFHRSINQAKGAVQSFSTTPTTLADGTTTAVATDTGVAKVLILPDPATVGSIFLTLINEDTTAIVTVQYPADTSIGTMLASSTAMWTSTGKAWVAIA
jgi:hypothetical protein